MISYELYFLYEIDDCKISEKGLEYRGKRQTTRDGIQCQRWDSVYPHYPSPSISFPSSSLSAQENFCRNPDGEPAPWCYTMDPDVRWQACDVPFCFEGKYNFIDLISFKRQLYLSFLVKKINKTNVNV